MDLDLNKWILKRRLASEPVILDETMELENLEGANHLDKYDFIDQFTDKYNRGDIQSIMENIPTPISDGSTFKDYVRESSVFMERVGYALDNKLSVYNAIRWAIFHKLYEIEVLIDKNTHEIIGCDGKLLSSISYNNNTELVNNLLCANCQTPLIMIKGFKQWKQYKCKFENCDEQTQVLVG